MLVNGFEPPVDRLEAAVLDKKLNDVFKARAKPRATGREVKSRHLMRTIVTCARQEVSERTTLAVHLNM